MLGNDKKETIAICSTFVAGSEKGVWRVPTSIFCSITLH